MSKEPTGDDAPPPKVVSTADFEDVEMKAFLMHPETSKRELWSWYAYDWANSVIYNTVLSSFLGPYMLTVAGNNEGEDHLFEIVSGVRISSSTYYSALVPVSVVMQIIVFLFFGAVGDFGSMRKKLLILSGLTGAIATTLLVAVYDETYWLSGVCLVILQVSLGFSLIQYNAYMPLLIVNLPELRAARGTPQYDILEITTSNRVSTRGFVFGYAAGIILLLINVGISVGTGSSCKQWCRECPYAVSNATHPGWDAFEYEITNSSMLQEGYFCSLSLTCMAWPGINPPCGDGPGDIANGTCINDATWQHYEYSPMGTRWSLNFTAANVTLAAENAAKERTVCTFKPTAFGDGINTTIAGSNVTIGLFPALAVGNGNEGCPFFRCSRNDCARGYDPSTCDPYHIGSRMNLMSGGLWWGLFGLITYFGLHARPGPPFPKKDNIFKAGLKRTWATFKKVRKLRHTFLFLASFFFYGDGFSTIGFAAAIVATEKPLFFSNLQLGLLLLESNFTALLGNFFFEWFAKKLVDRWLAKQIAAGANHEQLDSYWVCRVVIFINLAFVCLMPLWGIPGSGGLITALEFYIAAGIYGFQTGSYQSFSRTLLAHFTPMGCESEFFTFYELTDKGSAWLGPIVITVIRESTGEIRWGLFAIVFFFIIGAIFMYFVDTKQGGLEAADFHATAEVMVNDIVAENPGVVVVEEPHSERDLKKRLARKRTVTASELDIPNELHTSGGGLLANEAPDPQATPPTSARRKTTSRKGTRSRKNTRKRTATSGADDGVNEDSEGFSTRQLPLPDVPQEESDEDVEIKAEESDEEERRNDD